MTDAELRALQIAPATLKLYALRTSFNLFELACLAHRCNPESIAHRAHADIAAYRRATFGDNKASPMPEEVLALVDAMPERMLGAPIGPTLAALKLASGSNTVRRAIDRADSRRLVERLGYSLPAELGTAEAPAERAARRLARFRELGGDLRRAGQSWQLSGRRGALADLVREEAGTGRPQSKRQDVTSDLKAAASQMQY